ncbi:MAG: transmembrane 220 family protein, partial [candidate division Zixibacteria bacterium]|nr:transmembrane 220 family protein [candidate division Zixibacteria bacterium]
MIHKILSALWGFMFLAFAALQYNDPDPLIWFLAYGVITVVSFVYLKYSLPNWALIGLIMIYVITAIMLFPDEFGGVTGIMSDEHPEIEQARESLGLGICA